jgi:dihydropyrimidinase
VKAYHAKADGQCYVDVSFHLVISDPSASVLGQELPALVDDGYTSFRVFMTCEDLMLTDIQLLEVFSTARETGALVMVHAGNYDAIRFLTGRLERAGSTAPRFHTTSRPIPVEREATHRAISLAELIDVPLMIVHVSNGETMEEIRWAQQRGLKVFAETCPQYLVLTEKDLDGLNMKGVKYVCSPPPRDAASQRACWLGLETGVFQVFSSDHCPFRYDDPAGKLAPKGRTSFRWVPNGIPGAETRLPILFSEGVVKGRITLNQFVALSATNHARMYGLHPREGTIAIGADADIAIWDPDRKVRISQAMLHHGPDYTPYEGLEVTGWPVMTIVRGRTVVRDGALVGEVCVGEHVARERSPYAIPRRDSPLTRLRGEGQGEGLPQGASVRPDRSQCPHGPRITLSFDNGPDPKATPQDARRVGQEANLKLRDWARRAVAERARGQIRSHDLPSSLGPPPPRQPRQLCSHRGEATALDGDTPSRRRPSMAACIDGLRPSTRR